MAYIELSRSNYFHNLDLLSQKAGGVDKLAVVLKDNAYGHGLKQMAEQASEFGVTKAVVKNDAEADLIDDLFDLILVLMPKCDSKYSQTINSIEQLNSTKQGSKVHLKIDSGMHRNGIDESQIKEALELIEQKNLILEGVMTHFRSSDDLSSDLFWQMKNWDRIKTKVSSLTKQKLLFHSLASSSLIRSNMSDDFARCGIATYGYSELDESFGSQDLKPVLTLYAEILSSKNLTKDKRVGYSGVGVLSQYTTVSTYDIGYGDGFFRYDGLGDFMIDNKMVVGRVSMDSISLISDEKSVKFIGDAKEIARYFGTISYDVLVKLSPFIERRVL
jgi:alanine racemase